MSGSRSRYEPEPEAERAAQPRRPQLQRRKEPAPPPPAHDPFEAAPDRANRTWWERHSITVMAVISLVMLIFVITFQMSC